MSMQINLPINQVRLTNVAVVRMNKGGKRFEIACYRNKVVNYRQGLEKDLSEVLQTERIFANVSKGEFAKVKDLLKVFDTKDEDEISKMILMKGQLQVSDKERSQQLEKTSSQIADWLSKNCVDPSSERPYTVFQIREALNKASFSAHATKPLKRQYLDCVKLLQRVIPIRRAQMELLVLIPSSGSEGIVIFEEEFTKHNVSWSLEERRGIHESYRIFVEPSLYRVLNDVSQAVDGSRIEIVTQVVTKQGDSTLDAGVLSGNAVSYVSQNSNSEQSTLKEVQLDPVVKKSSADFVQQNDSDSGENAHTTLTMSRRQQQKNAKKKNKKTQRRENQESLDGSVISALCVSAAGEASDVESRKSPTIQTTLQTSSAAPGAGAPANGSDRKSCNTCGGDFATASSYRAHFKSDWHRFNQKLKMKGATPISEQEFLMCDSGSLIDNMLPM